MVELRIYSNFYHLSTYRSSCSTNQKQTNKKMLADSLEWDFDPIIRVKGKGGGGGGGAHYCGDNYRRLEAG